MDGATPPPRLTPVSGVPHGPNTFLRTYRRLVTHRLNNIYSDVNPATRKTLQDSIYRQVPSRLTHRLFHLLVPSVHAAETSGTDALTMSQKVAASRPKIHVSDEEIEDFLAKETGRDRLREMFTKQQDDRLSPELELVAGVTEHCALISFVLSSFFGAREAKEKFIENNKHTKFPTKLRASRAFNDAIFLGGLKTGLIWSVKTAIFTGFFMGTAQCISVYRNKTSPMDYILGAAFTGGLLKVNLGVRGFVAGSIIGSVFGALGGITVYGMMLASNETQEQRHYWDIYNRIHTKREIELLQSGAQGLQDDSPDFETAVQVAS